MTLIYNIDIIISRKLTFSLIWDFQLITKVLERHVCYVSPILLSVGDFTSNLNFQGAKDPSTGQFIECVLQSAYRSPVGKRLIGTKP